MTFSMQVAIGRETREVEFYTIEACPGMAFSDTQGLFCKGNGGKLWPEKLQAKLIGGVWTLKRSAVILNRNGYVLTAFADTVQGHRSNHNSA